MGIKKPLATPLDLKFLSVRPYFSQSIFVFLCASFFSIATVMRRMVIDQWILFLGVNLELFVIFSELKKDKKENKKEQQTKKKCDFLVGFGNRSRPPTQKKIYYSSNKQTMVESACAS